MSFLTDFADQAVILPLAVVLAVALAVAGWRRGALAWCLAVPVTLALVLAAKVTVASCGQFLPLSGLRNPSGHTASAALVYGGLLALVLPQARRGPRVVWIAAAIALVFGVTRLALHVHSRSDVVVGAGIGVLGAMLLARLAGPRPPHVRIVLPVAAALVIVVMFHGQHLRAEDRIHRVARLVWPLTECVPR
jgi:membrane-associated phospholipid phosphatase